LGRFFFVVKLESEASVFGEELDQYYSQGRVTIPPVLEILRDQLVAAGGFKLPGIFLQSGDEEELMTIRDKLNRDIPFDCKDLHCIANLVIAWLKELASPLLGGLPEGLLLSAAGDYECLSLLDMLKEPNRGIFKWVLDMIGDISLEFSSNGVDFNSLIDCFSKVLYIPSSADPTKNEKLAERVSNMVALLAKYRLKLRESS
jgi:hypothetical protein